MIDQPSNEGMTDIQKKWFYLVDNAIYSNLFATSIEEAFEKSICKWELLVEGKRLGDAHTDSCGLCNLFIINDCDGCPVFQKTNLILCRETPYINYPDDKNAAKKELAFLRKLEEDYFSQKSEN